MAAILKIVMTSELCRWSSHYYEIWHAAAKLHASDYT